MSTHPMSVIVRLTPIHLLDEEDVNFPLECGVAPNMRRSNKRLEIVEASYVYNGGWAECVKPIAGRRWTCSMSRRKDKNKNKTILFIKIFHLMRRLCATDPSKPFYRTIGVSRKIWALPCDSEKVEGYEILFSWILGKQNSRIIQGSIKRWKVGTESFLEAEIKRLHDIGFEWELSLKVKAPVSISEEERKIKSYCKTARKRNRRTKDEDKHLLGED